MFTSGMRGLFALIIALLWTPARAKHLAWRSSCQIFVARAVVGLGLGFGVCPQLGGLSLPLGDQMFIARADSDGDGAGLEELDGEPLRIFMKAQSAMSDGDFPAAQGFFEQVVEVVPNAIYAWSNLGNVLVSQGNLDQALLCYKKAISLHPRRDQLGLIVLNRASVEMGMGKNEAAIRDLEAAERLTGPTPEIVTTRAVALSNNGEWDKAATLFEEIIKTSDRDALPWWLRYSESLLETGRGTEAVAFLQRTLNRFPYEDDCKGFAVALYSSLGAKDEAQRYWKTMGETARSQYTDSSFQQTKLRWGPKTIAGFNSFMESKYAKIPPSEKPTAIRQGQEISSTRSSLLTAALSKKDFLDSASQGKAIDLRDKSGEFAPPPAPLVSIPGSIRLVDLGGEIGARGLASDGTAPTGPSLVEQLKAFGGPGAVPSNQYGTPGYVDESLKNPFVKKGGGVSDQLQVFQRLNQGK